VRGRKKAGADEKGTETIRLLQWAKSRVLGEGRDADEDLQDHREGAPTSEGDRGGRHTVIGRHADGQVDRRPKGVQTGEDEELTDAFGQAVRRMGICRTTASVSPT